MPADGIDFEDLSNRLRKERQGAADRLTKAEPTFYSDAESYIRHLAEEAHRESELHPTGTRATLLLDELRNARRALDDLYDLREHKIVDLAVTATRGTSVDRSGMTKGEQELFDSLVRVLRDARRSLLRHGERLPGEEAAPPKSEAGWPESARITAPPAAPAPDAPPAPPPERPLASAAPAKTARVLVRVLEKVPAFTASDLRTYQLAAEDVVALPKEAAKTLVLHGKATYVTGA